MIIPGQPIDLDAYRCELGGLFGITVITNALFTYQKHQHWVDYEGL